MAEKGKRAAALGIFDGVHLGHRRVVSIPAEMAEKGFIPSVFTFRSDTLAKKQGRSLEYIYTDENRERIIKSLGIKELFSEDFAGIRELSGEEFVRELLVKRLNTGIVVCGEDFRFGHNAACGAAELSQLGEKYGFEVIIVPEERIDGEKVSSRKIRQLLSEGAVCEASRLLGSGYTVYGEVVRGAQLGRTIGFPTVNQHFESGQLVPAYGVYVSSTTVGGRQYRSMTNIGVKPTVEYGGAPLAETYIDGFSGDLYGERLCVELIDFIRPERKLGSLEELQRQISADIAACHLKSL